jgi:periplasmic protein TonB
VNLEDPTIEAVSDVLQSRMREPGGFSYMAAVSLAAHLVAVGSVLAAPTRWIARESPAPRLVMTISLGGAPGPRAGGLTMTGGRPVQSVGVPEPRRAEPAPAPRAQMTVPVPDARARATTQSSRGAERSAGRTPTRGAEERPGSAMAETGGRGMGFGLSTGGGGTGGYLDVGNFCCPDYLVAMLQLIQRNWNPRQEVPGEVQLRFTILRDGSITGVEVEQSSRYAALDLAAQRALLTTSRLPALPQAFDDDHLTVHLRFQYQR